MMLTLPMFLSAAALAVPAAQCDSNESSATLTSATVGGKTIVETAVAAGSFQTLAAALDAAGLVDALQGDGPFTVFAPTDEAFAALPKGTVEHLLKKENLGTLQAILKFHVVAGDVDASQALRTPYATTLNGQKVSARFDDGSFTINGATVVAADIECSNGTIHVIDRVILPNTADIVDTAAGAGSFKTLVTAVKTAGLVEALKADGPITVFAPTDEAFAKLPAETLKSLLQPENRSKLQAILTYHVVPGRVYSSDALSAGQATTLQGGKLELRVENGALRINDAAVVQADLDTTNGVIHVIDSVLLP